MFISLCCVIGFSIQAVIRWGGGGGGGGGGGEVGRWVSVYLSIITPILRSASVVKSCPSAQAKCRAVLP